MKCAIHPNYTKDEKMMVSVVITLLIDNGEDERVDNFLRTTKAKGVLEINGLPPMGGKNLAVDIRA